MGIEKTRGAGIFLVTLIPLIAILIVLPGQDFTGRARARMGGKDRQQAVETKMTGAPEVFIFMCKKIVSTSKYFSWSLLGHGFRSGYCSTSEFRSSSTFKSGVKRWYLSRTGYWSRFGSMIGPFRPKEKHRICT